MGSGIERSKTGLSGMMSGLRAALPAGGSLTREAWEVRHKAILALLWIHVAGVFVYALFTGNSVEHSFFESGLIALCGIAAGVGGSSRSARSFFSMLGLISSSAILVHLSGGYIEMHFHFFVMVAVVALYQSWVPFLLAIGFVLVHHGVIGVIDPAAVYNHPDALTHPWKWAAIHALFIAGESIAVLATWKLNERTLAAERAARSALELAVADLAEVQALTHIGGWEWDVEKDEVVWSDELYRICGVTPGDFVPSVEGYLSLIPDEGRSEVRRLLEDALARGGDFEYLTRIRRPDGTERVVYASGRAVINKTGVLHRFVGTLQDVTERKQLEDRVRHQAFHDSLTGLPNRDLFRDRVEHARARQSRGTFSIGVLFIDLDEFKQINDTMGHRLGDDYLVEIGRKISAVLRPADTLARLGGDEFAVLLEEIGSVSDATVVADRILQVINETPVVHGDELPRTASIGIVLEDAPGVRDADELVRDSDIAMYAAKRKGKGRYEVFDAAMREALAERLSLKLELQRAIENDELFLEYQPVIRVDSGEVEGYEALVRWRHPEKGIVPPLEFIPFAEDTGQISQIEQWVIRHACKDLSRWHERFPHVRGLHVSINVSPIGFLRQDFVTELSGVLDEFGLPGGSVVLELTERVLLADSDAAAARLEALTRLGVKLAIDDFGTGYSSLSYIKNFPINLLKIDKSFVDGVGAGPEGSALAKAAVKLGDALGLPVVAEGVETQKQADALAEMGCHFAQGYLFSRPVGVEIVEEVLGARVPVEVLPAL